MLVQRMHALQTAIAIAWIAFWVYWFAPAFGAKKGKGGGRQVPLRGVAVLAVVLLLRVNPEGGSASVEEKNLTASFPTAYPAYRDRTKMLIPFVL